MTVWTSGRERTLQMTMRKKKKIDLF